MSAISSLSSFNSFRPAQSAAFQSHIQRSPTSYGTNNAARSGNTANASSTYCPTCGGGAGAARSSSGTSSSYCPTCNTAGGRQSNVTSFNNSALASRTGSPAANSHNHQGGQICVACAYQGR